MITLGRSLLLLTVLAAWPAAAAEQIYLVTRNGGTNGHGLNDADGTLYRIDADTGVRTLVSDFGDATEGPFGDGPIRALAETAGQVLVADPMSTTFSDGTNNAEAPRIFRVNPENGQRTIVSDFADPSQGSTLPANATIQEMELEPSGSALVLTFSAGIRSLFRVDAATGQRTLGVVVANTTALAVAPNGAVVALTTPAHPSGLCAASNEPARGLLSTLDPSTGVATPIHDLGDPAFGPPVCAPETVLMDGNDRAVVIDASPAWDHLAIVEVDLVAGTRTMTTIDTAAVVPPSLTVPWTTAGAALTATGDLLFGLRGAVSGTAAVLYRIARDPLQITTLSDLRDGLQGPFSGDPRDFSVTSATTGALTQSYQCRKAAPEGGAAAPLAATLTDAFGTRDALLLKPTEVCLPVDVDGGGIAEPATHLTCFKAKNVGAVAPVKRRVEMTNAAGTQTLKVGTSKLVCLPSTRADLP